LPGDGVVDVLNDGSESNVFLFEQASDCGVIKDVPSQPVDLVDEDDIHFW
jgi:hypothetical protein